MTELNVLETIEKIQAHIEAGPAHEELTSATILCSELILQLNRRAENANLKACPFCGHQGIVIDEGFKNPKGDSEWYIECLNCPAQIWHPNKEVLIAAWNRRADDAGRLREAFAVLVKEWARIKSCAKGCGIDYNLPRRVEDAFAVIEECLPASPSAEPKPTGLRWCANSECDSNKDEGCGNFCSRHWALLPDAARKIEAAKKPAPAKEEPSSAYERLAGECPPAQKGPCVPPCNHLHAKGFDPDDMDAGCACGHRYGEHQNGPGPCAEETGRCSCLKFTVKPAQPGEGGL